MAEIAQRFIEERSKELPVYLRLQQQYQERVLQPELERQHTRIEELKAERSPLDMSKVRARLRRASSLGRCRQLREHETEYLQKHQAMWATGAALRGAFLLTLCFRMSKSLPKPTTAPQRPATQYYHGAAFRTAVLEDRSRLEADIRKDMALRERKQRLQEYATQIRVSSPACRCARLLTCSQQQYVPTPDEAKRAEREARLAKLHTKPREQKKTPSNAPTVRSPGPRRRRGFADTALCSTYQARPQGKLFCRPCKRFASRLHHL